MDNYFKLKSFILSLKGADFLNTKLIIVEGLPGFGKSTTANLLYDILIEKNIDVELFLEGNLDHPADYEGVSCFNKSEFKSMLVNSGIFR